uniref:Integrase n=1 Tax=uncultured bacterium Contig575 TaxID=1393592 RepID=W0FHY3_9BACT|nr:integrase [uncultured bacterium Contig575]
MPWKETDAMKEKRSFIDAMLRQSKPFRELCREYGISEKTGYKWRKRFLEQGYSGLEEESRAPQKHPNTIDGDTAAELIALRLAHPSWGGKKLLVLWRRSHPNQTSPSLSSVNRILEKAKLLKKKRIHKTSVSSDCPRLNRILEAHEPNDVWCIDFKGWWRSDGELCEPFTVRDKCSRKVLCARLMTGKTTEHVRPVMTELFRKYGLPKAIHSDNGSPFAATNGILGLTKLTAWWITLGILPERSLPGCPGQNGSLERMHADIAREIEGKIPGGIAANQIALDEWVEEYNSIRPNEAIGMLTPDEVYHPSERKYVGDFDILEYPAGFFPRKVFKSGEIILDGVRVTIGSSLRGWHVGLRARKEPGIYDVFLADFLLGFLDMTSCCFTPLTGVESD